MSERLRIVVLGYLVRGPIGGMAWHQIQYPRGLADLGHDVWFVEDSDDYPSCYDPRADAMGTDPAYGMRFAATELGRLGLGDRWAYHDSHTERWLGPGGADAVRGADVLLNLCGVNPWRAWMDDVPVRVLVDCDPAFTQIRHLTDPEAAGVAARHTSFFSFGERIGHEGCEVPDDGLPWQPTRQPILVDRLETVAPAPAGAPWTSVLQWESYPAREHGGRRFGLKRDSLEAMLDLPGRTAAVLAPAVGAPDEARSLLRRHGWEPQDGLAATRDVPTYHAFIAGSRGELAVAKHGYVSSRSGWFSERSATYLAAGRPVVAQDTGFTDVLPTGDGLLAFTTAGEAAEAIAAVEADHARHGRAARELARARFAAEDVLGSLLERAT